MDKETLASLTPLLPLAEGEFRLRLVLALENTLVSMERLAEAQERTAIALEDLHKNGIVCFPGEY